MIFSLYYYKWSHQETYKGHKKCASPLSANIKVMYCTHKCVNNYNKPIHYSAMGHSVINTFTFGTKY